MLQAAICDNDARFLKQFSEQLDQVLKAERFYEVQTFLSGKELENAIHKGYYPSILFMDIELGDENGIGCIRRIAETCSRTQIIYISSYQEYFQDVYETPHVYFLRKPVENDMLERAVRKAEENLLSYQDLAFCSDGSVFRVPKRDILYFESRYRKIIVHTERSEFEFYATIQQMEEKAGQGFLQCHKSFLVNLSRIAAMTNGYFRMDDGRCVPISRSKAAFARQAFLEYLGESL